MPVERVVRFRPVSLILDIEDRHARERRLRGAKPRPLGRLDVEVTGRIGDGGREDFARPVPLVLQRNGDGYLLFFGLVRGADGILRRDALPPGTWALRVSSPERIYQTLERDVDVANPPDADADRLVGLELEPGAAYPFGSEAPLPGRRRATLLRGGLRDADGSGIEGAVVEVPGVTRRSRTDDAGEWLLTFPDSRASDPVSLRIGFPDGTTADVADVPIVAGAESSLPATVLRGRVQTASGAAVAGARVGLAGADAAATSSETGAWAYFFRPDQIAATVTVRAVHPDGRALQQPGVRVLPRETVAVRPFRFG